MCLDNIYSKKKRDALIAKHQKGRFITVWKVFAKLYDGYGGWFHYYTFKAGKNKTKVYEEGDYEYEIAFHSCLTKYGAGSFCTVGFCEKTIRCKVPVKSITAIGEQNGHVSIVSTEIICPKYFGSKK